MCDIIAVMCLFCMASQECMSLDEEGVCYQTNLATWLAVNYFISYDNSCIPQEAQAIPSMRDLYVCVCPIGKCCITHLEIASFHTLEADDQTMSISLSCFLCDAFGILALAPKGPVLLLGMITCRTMSQSMPT